MGTEEGTSDNDYYSVLIIRAIYDTNGLETKKLVNIGSGEDAIVNLNIPVDWASPVNFLKQNLFTNWKWEIHDWKNTQLTRKLLNYIAALPTIQLTSSGKS